MPRQACVDTPGSPHDVMVPEIKRRKIVQDCWNRQEYVRPFGEPARDTGAPVWRRGKSPISQRPEILLLEREGRG
jgi:hypothetical protein